MMVINYGNPLSQYDFTCHCDKLQCEMVPRVNALGGCVYTYIEICNGQMNICYTRIYDCNAIY